MRHETHSSLKGEAGAGFTLMEMLVVLAILGLLSLVALPRLRLDEGARSRALVHALAVDVRLARHDAIRRGVITAIVPTVGGYLIKPSGRILHLPDGASLRTELMAAQLVPGNEEGMRFFPDGSSTGGIFALHQGNLVTRMTVRGVDGKVRLHER